MDYDRKRTGTGSRFTAIVLCILCAVWALVLLGITGPKTAYAAESEQKTVRVGYVNALNYEEGGEGEYKHGSGYEENGQMIGVMQTVVQAIHESFGVEVETIPYDTLDEMSQAVRDGEVDMAGPMISDFYLAEQADQVLTIMDIMMPRRNGYEAIRAIRSMENRPDGQTIPIIAMTANAFAEDIQASLDAGMNAHLSKPIVMEEVLRTIDRNLNR